MPALLSPSLANAIVKQDHNPALMKRCSKCKELLPFALFSKDARNKDQLQFWCKSCHAKYCKNHYKENPVQIKTAKMVSLAKGRAKDKNLPFDIDVDYVRSLVGENAELALRCPVFDIPLDYSTQRTEGTGHALPNSPSIDRIVPELGYVKGNIRIISFRANQLKSNASIQELKLVLADATMLGIDW